MGEKGRKRIDTKLMDDNSRKAETRRTRKNRTRRIARERQFWRDAKAEDNRSVSSDDSVLPFEKQDSSQVVPVQSELRKFEIRMCAHGEIRETCPKCRTIIFLCCMKELKKEGLLIPKPILKMIAEYSVVKHAYSCARCYSFNVFSDRFFRDCPTCIIEAEGFVYLRGFYGSVIDDAWVEFLDEDEEKLRRCDFRRIYLPKTIANVLNLRKLNICNCCVSELIAGKEVGYCEPPDLHSPVSRNY